MVVVICGKYENNRSRTENVTERTRFSKSRSNDLEDMGQGQRSSHATHLLMLVIICIKCGNNPSRTVDATERTRFSRSRPNDLEDIGQGQSSLYETRPLILVIICAKYIIHWLRTLVYVMSDCCLLCFTCNFAYSVCLTLCICMTIKLFEFEFEYGKNSSRTVDFFFQGQSRKI